MFKRITSLLLALVMVLSMVPAQAFAAETEAVEETVAETAATEPTQAESVPETEEVEETTAATEPEDVPETTATTEPEDVPETTAAATEPEETVPTEEAMLPEETEALVFEPDESWSQEEYDLAKQQFVSEMIAASASTMATQSGNRLSNEYLEFAIASNGRFTVGTTGGNPEISTDNNKKLLYGHSSPSTSYTTIRVNGANYIYGDSGFVKAPSFSGNSNISEAVFGNIRVKQVISLVQNASTMREDVVEVKYIVTNEGTSSTSFGLRIMMDTMLGNNDHAPFRIPGQGDVTTEMEFIGSSIPQYWQAFDSLTNPNVVSYGTFLSGNIRPTKVQFTNWGRVYNEAWGYQVQPGVQNGDSAVSVIWERNLDAGRSETYVTRYGLSELLQDLQPPLSLTIASGANIKAENRVYPAYTISAFVQNLGNGAAHNTICKIDLPQYLAFEDPNETGIISLGELSVGLTIPVERKVRVINVPEDGVTTSYTVSVSADNAATKQLTKQLTISPRDSYEYHNTLDELTTLDYLAFAQVAYEDFVINQSIQECLTSKPGNKWDDVWSEIDDIKYSELCGPIAKWRARYISRNVLTGFYAVMFQNADGGCVLAIRGSIPPNQWGDNGWDAIADWAINDLPMILLNLEGVGNQFSDAINAYDRVSGMSGVSEIHVTGHSLGGLWGNVISSYSGCKGVTFNAITGLDVIHYNHPELMGKEFEGINIWNFMDNANCYDVAAGMTEVFATPLGATMLKPFYMYESNYDPLSVGNSHSMKSLVSRDSAGKLKMNTTLGAFRPDTAISNRMTMTNHSIDMGTTNIDLFNKGLSVAIARTSYGGNGMDQIYSSVLNDRLIGGKGQDTIDGSWGNDTYIYFKGNGLDYIYDTDGFDKLYLYGFSDSDNISVDSGAGDYVVVYCNNQAIVKIHKEGRAYSLATLDSFKIYIDRPGQDPDVFDITSSFKTKRYTEHVVLRCPINVEIVDADGNVVYVLEDGIVGTVYTEYGNFYVFEEEDGGYGKVADLAEGYTARIVGMDTGTMEIDYHGVKDGDLKDSRSFTEVPVSTSFTATFEKTSEDELVLAADRDGDGRVDAKIGYDGQVIPVESVTLSHEYAVLKPGENMRIDAVVQPAVVADFLTWRIEEGSEGIISMDDEGNIIAHQTGTGYVLAEVFSGVNTITARCRIDVAETAVTEPSNEPVVKLDGIQLGVHNLTTELYKTDYARFEILLKLPQNYSEAFEQTESVPVDNGVAIDYARFTDPAVAEIFDLVAMDDHRIAVVPTEYALQNPNKLVGSYKSKVTVAVDGTEYTTEDELTLTVKKSLPKLKAAGLSYNAFYNGQTQEIKISGGTVTKISSKNIPDWLTLNDDFTLSLNENAKSKNSGKAILTVETKEWNIPAEVTLNVKNVYKVPGLKLSASTVKMTTDVSSSSGVSLKLLPKNKRDTLKSLNVEKILAPAGYTIDNFNVETGSFALKAEGELTPSKITLLVKIGGTEETVPLTLQIKSQAVVLKLSKKSVTLNVTANDSAVISVSATPEDYRLDDLTVTGNEAEELQISFADGDLIVQTTEKTRPGRTYKLYVQAGGSKTVALSVKTIAKNPTATLKVKGNVDLTFPNKGADVAVSFKNYNGKILAFTETVFDPDGNVTDALRVTRSGKSFLIQAKDSEIPLGNYTLKVELALADGEVIDAQTKVPVKRTAAKLKLSASKLTLNSAIADRASVTVTCTTKGYAFTEPVIVMDDSTAEKLDVSYADGKFTVATNTETEYGKSYKITLKANDYAPGSTLTVTVPTEAKSKVTASLKASGKIDVIRDGSAVTVTPSYKNCVTPDADEALFIYNSKKECVNDLFCIEPNGNGSYTVTKAEGAALTAGTYKIKLAAKVGEQEIESKQISLTVTMAAAKLAVKTSDTTLFAKDKHDRALVWFETADAALNAVSKVEIKDAKYQDKFEVIDYGNGEFAIGFKGDVDQSLAGKTVTLNLNVFIEGNQTAKANATAKVKLMIVG